LKKIKSIEKKNKSIEKTIEKYMKSKKDGLIKREALLHQFEGKDCFSFQVRLCVISNCRHEYQNSPFPPINKLMD